MKKTAQQGSWQFELKQVFCRKTLKYGDDFEASAVITIVDEIPHVELLINKNSDQFTKKDYRDFKAFLTKAGFKNAKRTRFKNGVKTKVEKIA